jgi:sulfur-oxidizing protein SoxY
LRLNLQKKGIKMDRRKFITTGVVLVATLPMALSAVDFRKDKPESWTAKKQDEAIKKLYGDIKPEEKGVKVKTPDVASNGGAVPVAVKSDIEAKTVAVFQDVNPESLVGVWTIPEGQDVDFEFKIKMKGTGTITAIVEGKDGKFYVGKKKLEVALGGCEG